LKRSGLWILIVTVACSLAACLPAGEPIPSPIPPQVETLVLADPATMLHVPTLTETTVATVSPTASSTATIASSPTSSATPEPTETPALDLTSNPPLAGTAPPLAALPVTFITSGDRDLPYVALTFDLCQDPLYPAWFDDGIYDVLVEYQAPATFFAGGDWMRTHPEETRLLANNPLFELGNHSWSHPDLRTLPEADISAEILKTQDLMYQLTGEQTLLFRLPAGFYNDQVLGVIAWRGLYTIQWDVVTGDPDPSITAEGMLENAVKPRTQNGSIIIMHANGRGWNTAAALPEIIEYLRGEGYTLVTVSQLIGLEPLP
jgi:peptidoglycan/xylan/chitin deacetylase (PgdA/CDA1 family)